MSELAGFETATDLRDWLLGNGVPDDEVRRAEEDGTLPLLALEVVVADEPIRYDLAEVSAKAGVEPDVIRAYWRALGFVDPPAGQRMFGDLDVAMVTSVADFVEDETLDRDLVLMMARVIGSSMERVASAQVDAIESRDPDAPSQELTAEELAGVRRGAELLPLMPMVMDYVWRRQVAAVARRRRLRVAARESETMVCVGFADLVGFTAQTQQLSEHELAEVVGRFESVSYDVVASDGGRVVKMIGDAVMFMAESVEAGADIALDLAETFRADEHLSDVRVGLAAGAVLEREGDVYGPVVNLASRIVAMAYPGAVVVSPEVHAALAVDDRFVLKTIRQHYLKDIGRVRLWTMRRSGDEAELAYRNARERRAARREFLLERRAERMGEGFLTGDEPTEEFEAITDAVLTAGLDEEMQVELLADIEAARRLAELEREAQAKAEEADLEAEDKLERIEEEARKQVERIETEARRRIDEVLSNAEEKAKRANEEASRKVKRVADEAERKADQAEKEARREAERKTAKARAEREAEEQERAKEKERNRRANDRRKGKGRRRAD